MARPRKAAAEGTKVRVLTGVLRWTEDDGVHEAENGEIVTLPASEFERLTKDEAGEPWDPPMVEKASSKAAAAEPSE